MPNRFAIVPVDTDAAIRPSSPPSSTRTADKSAISHRFAAMPSSKSTSHGKPRPFEPFLERNRLVSTRIGNDRLATFGITRIAGFEHYKMPPIFSKSLHFIRFNFVSYDQKKFDIALSFLIPSDASNLTNCPLRNRFRSTSF